MAVQRKRFRIEEFQAEAGELSMLDGFDGDIIPFHHEIMKELRFPYRVANFVPGSCFKIKAKQVQLIANGDLPSPRSSIRSGRTSAQKRRFSS